MTQLDSGKLHAQEFLIPLGSAVGWEAAVFDHIQAVVQTICQRLQAASALAPERTDVGGSTYTFDVWDGHPLEQEVRRQLQEIRERCGELRRRVTEHNANSGIPKHYDQITTYVGQCCIERENEQFGNDEDGT